MQFDFIKTKGISDKGVYYHEGGHGYPGIRFILGRHALRASLWQRVG